MVLAQYSRTSYKVVNPELGIGVFDTILSLLVLYILGDTQTGQFNLGFDIREDPFCGTSNTGLDISSKYGQREKVLIYLKEVMEPNISFFILLHPANKTFPAGVVSISTDVATDFALGGVVSWARVGVDLEPHLCS